MQHVGPPTRRLAGDQLLQPIFSFSDGQLLRTRRRRRTSKCWAISWLVSFEPSELARRNNLDRDIYRANRPLVPHQVYGPAAYVGEALACAINVRSAGGVVGLVNCELSSCNRDQAGTRMRVPPSVSPDWERALGDIDVRISLHLQLEVPPV